MQPQPTMFMTMYDDIRERFTLWLNFMLLLLHKLRSGRNGMKYRTNMTLRGAVCGCAWDYGINWTIINLVYCAVSVYVCVSVNGLGFYYPATPKNAPAGIDNPKKVVSCEPFILQFIRKMSVFRIECTGLRVRIVFTSKLKCVCLL